MKFVRGLIYPSANFGQGRDSPWRMKWMYEFWGFCINGTASLTVPGGLAANNGTNMPVNFTNGTSLLASGSDGYHPDVPGNLFSGDCIFTAQSSAPFTASMVGKLLVMWVPNSDSSMDSIYLITQVISSTQIMVNINTGGIPDPTTKHPSMTTRSGVNYRVVDPEVGALAGYFPGAFIVIQTAASLINPGQANSQIQFTQGGPGQGGFSGLAGSNAQLLVGMSGTGSWNGTTFTATAATNTTPIAITTSVNHGFTTNQTVTISGALGNTAANGNWAITVTGANTFTLVGSAGNGTYTANSGTVWNGFQNDGYAGLFAVGISTNQAYTSGQTSVAMIGDKTFLALHIRDQDLFQTNGHVSWHFEIPQRLYPQNQDLHPMMFLPETLNTGWIYTSSTTAGYGGGCVMRTHSSDVGAVRNHRLLVKAMQGDGEIQVNGSPVSPAQGVFGQNLSDYRLGYNTTAGTIPISDGILCLPGVANQWSYARCKLRTVKFTGTHVPKHHRIGLNGEFIQLQNGVCWAWDNTIIPVQLMLFG